MEYYRSGAAPTGRYGGFCGEGWPPSLQRRSVPVVDAMTRRPFRLAQSWVSVARVKVVESGGSSRSRRRAPNNPHHLPFPNPLHPMHPMPRRAEEPAPGTLEPFSDGQAVGDKNSIARVGPQSSDKQTPESWLVFSRLRVHGRRRLCTASRIWSRHACRWRSNSGGVEVGLSSSLPRRA